MRVPRLARFLSPVLLAVLAGCNDPPKSDPPKTTAPAAAADAKTAGARVADAGYLAIDAASSTVGFVGAKAIGKHEGKFTAFSGQVGLVGGKAEGGKVIVSIDLGSVKTDDEKLDGHLKSPDFFDVAKFPKATFTSTEVKAGGDKGATHTITGTLDLHGVTKTISFPATITVSGDAVSATAEFTINRKEFGIVYPGMPDNLIKDDVAIKLSIKAKKG
ncbi:MAG: YceI family protein [Byssovorax sp.]